MVNVKILSYKSTQRFAVKRTLMAAQNELRKNYPDLNIAITEVKELSEMEKYTAVVILPSLVVNDKLVCIGRFPEKDEIIDWLQDMIER
jgi:hypothetical protein